MGGLSCKPRDVMARFRQAHRANSRANRQHHLSAPELRPRHDPPDGNLAHVSARQAFPEAYLVDSAVHPATSQGPLIISGPLKLRDRGERI